MKMQEHTGILRKVGLVLIIVGVIDVGIMIYCIANKISYSSSFNIFAVAAGIFLMRGSLKAARIVSWIAALFLGAFAVIMLFIPWLVPPDLIAAYLRLRTSHVAVSLAVYLLVIALLIWVYRTLTSAPIKDAMTQSGLMQKSFWQKPSRGFWVGGCIAIGTAIAVFMFLYLLNVSEIAGEAKRRAAVQFGSGYQFYVISLEISHPGKGGKRVWAEVIAYNDKDIKSVKVEWSE